MSGRKLPVIEERLLSKREQLEKQIRSRMEEAWAAKSKKTILEKERIIRTRRFFTSLLSCQKVVDLGSGDSPFSQERWEVTAVDIAQSALDRCPPHVKRIRGCLPYVRLPEESFDLVLLTDVIAEIEPHLYRLLLSEASLLMKREAYCICSTELDYTSEDPLGHFLALLRTEFQTLKIEKSYHRLYIYLRCCLDAPSHFIQAAADTTLRLNGINKRTGLLRFWFYLNTLKWAAFFWRPLIPLKKSLHSRRLLLLLEKISQVLFGEAALTHVSVLCKRKPLHPQPK